jgi:amino-acid N-acetyltransferase
MNPRTGITVDIPPHCDAALATRKAAMADVPPLLALINGYARRGIMLPRTEFEIAENLRDFTVVEHGGLLAGCGALHFYGPMIGEVRSLAVEPDQQGSGAGRAIMDALEREAREFGLEAIFAFTYIPGFFARQGYAEIDRGELPLKAWKDCLRCPKFQCCDEIAVIKYLETDKLRVLNTLTRGVESPRSPREAELIHLPTVRNRR